MSEMSEQNDLHLVYPPVSKLMVVAHPDDESLFGGGQLIMEGGWKVVCITNGDNPVRRAEFGMVMVITNSRYEMWSYRDEQFTPLNEDGLKRDLSRVVAEQEWEKIVTHNEAGEYGHIHHQQIHRLMKELVREDLWTFNFDGPYSLPEDVWEAKVDLVSMYESQKHICDEHIKNVRNERITRGKILI